jgi:hypothetical protein
VTDTTPTGSTGADRPADPFVAQVQWLIGMTGGKDQLVARSGNRVSARTLDNWSAGVYPRAKVTGAVRDLDTWALANVPGYPEASGFPRLTDSCGPHRGTRHEAVAGSDAETDRPVPAQWAPWVRWALAAAVLVLVIAGTVVTTLLLTRQHSSSSAAGASGAGGATVGAVTASSLTAGKLPTNGNGTDLPEQTGGLGANTFADPRTLQDQEKKVPKRTTVMVRCRYYSPIIASVTPDGFWYLLDSGQWAGRWSPANSYMNGDLPGKPTLHNTDFAVPVCH